MGLDKKPTPPPKKVKDNGIIEETVASPKNTAEMETERTAEDASSHSECETSQLQDMETQVKEEKAPEEDKLRDGTMTRMLKYIKHLEMNRPHWSFTYHVCPWILCMLSM